MKIENSLFAIVVGCVFMFSNAAVAGLYLGTDAAPPVNQMGIENLAGGPPPPAQVPYFAEETTVIKDAAPPADCEPYNGKGPMPAVPCPLTGATPGPLVVGEPIVVAVRTGSLRENIDRITNQAGWEQVVWKPEYDYNWVGDVTITASDIQGVLTKLLEPYPLQAVFYSANHVVEIVPRRNT